MLTKEEIEKRIKNAQSQRDQLIANVNACEGAIAAFKEVLGLMAEKEPDRSK
ncbi:MAG: hypothetical protein JRE40_13540 [Deltaproteobacteria bacterium]|nr:hypothetical protein [Deltaproteobacteria bacterium]